MAAKKASKLQPTKNDLPQKTRAAVVPLLQQSLAEAFDLLSHAKQAHWNIKGPNFISLHKLFDEIAEASKEAAQIAEDAEAGTFVVTVDPAAREFRAEYVLQEAPTWGTLEKDHPR